MSNDNSNKTVKATITIPADAAHKIRLIAAAEEVDPNVWITSAVIRAIKSATSKSTMHWNDLREQFEKNDECDLDELLNNIFRICVLHRLNQDAHSVESKSDE